MRPQTESVPYLIDQNLQALGERDVSPRSTPR